MDLEVNDAEGPAFQLGGSRGLHDHSTRLFHLGEVQIGSQTYTLIVESFRGDSDGFCREINSWDYDLSSQAG